eukprot:m.2541 g.2541  ORF g.2541 m.2541 type:complete len:585 (+) comp8751_c0_seq1:91-1845(+)
MSKSLSEDIVRATNDERTEEDWALILDICDRVNASPTAAQEAVKAVKRRLNDPRPRVILYALSLLGALVDNCKKPLHLEVCSRDFVETASKLLQKSGPQQKISDKMKELILKWTKETFKGDHQLGIIELELLPKVRGGGSMVGGTQSGSSSRLSASQVQLKEDEDLAKAIQMSLNEETSSAAAAPQPTLTTMQQPVSMYPQLGQTSVSPVPIRRNIHTRSVRALFDFEAAESNELSFQAGEIIQIIDDSDPNWWKGRGFRGEGLFPSNFVTSDLAQRPPPPPAQVVERHVRYADEVGGSLVQNKPEISEEKIDLLLEMLKNADATEGNDEENATLKELEDECKNMGPLVVEKIREIEGRQAQLGKLKEQFEDAMTLYQRCMKEIPKPVFTLPSTVQVDSEPLPPAYGDPSTAAAAQTYSGPSHYGHSSLEQPMSLGYSGPRQQPVQMQPQGFYPSPAQHPVLSQPLSGQQQLPHSSAMAPPPRMQQMGPGPTQSFMPPQHFTEQLPQGQSAMSHGMDSLPAGFQSLSFGGPSYSQPGINVGPPGPALQQQPHQFSTGDSPYGRPHYVQHQLGPQAPVTQVTPLL